MVINGHLGEDVTVTSLQLHAHCGARKTEVTSVGKQARSTK